MHSKRMHSRYTQREHGGHKHDNASMHSASTKHGPVHPRDVDDFGERNTKAHGPSTHSTGTRREGGRTLKGFDQ